jgi:hypothetical protein
MYTRAANSLCLYCMPLCTGSALVPSKSPVRKTANKYRTRVVLPARGCNRPYSFQFNGCLRNVLGHEYLVVFCGLPFHQIHPLVPIICEEVWKTRHLKQSAHAHTHTHTHTHRGRIERNYQAWTIYHAVLFIIQGNLSPLNLLCVWVRFSVEHFIIRPVFPYGHSTWLHSIEGR